MTDAKGYLKGGETYISWIYDKVTMHSFRGKIKTSGLKNKFLFSKARAYKRETSYAVLNDTLSVP